MALRPYQQEAVKRIEQEWESGNRRTLIVMATGCHEPSQLILMAGGSMKRADEIIVGDQLMGPDGLPRDVLELHSGKTLMMKVTPIKGDPFIVTHDHVLPLVKTCRERNSKYKSRLDGAIVHTTPLNWERESKTFRHMSKLFRSKAIERFDGNDGSKITIDPYFIGVLLGDGEVTYSNVNVTTMEDEVVAVIKEQAKKYGATLRTQPSGKAITYFFRSGLVGRYAHGGLNDDLKALGMYGKRADNKSVPEYYKTLPLEQRLQVIAGLIDTDGCLSSDSSYDFISKSESLAKDLAYMCRSVGLAAYVRQSIKSAQSGYSGIYWRVSISGDCSIIPCRVKRRIASKRRQKKDVLRTGIKSVEPVGVGHYNGFTVSGDNLYLMGDFTVTHNCGKTIVMSELVRRVAMRGGNTLILAHRGELLDQAADKIRKITGLACAREQAENSSLTALESVTVGSVQTLMREHRLHLFKPDRFTHVFVDEAHHAVSDSYRKVLDYFDQANVLGVTATADRADRRGLSEVFDSLAYEYGMADAIHDGWLCPIEAQMIPLKLDISSVSIQSGDYAAGQLGDALEPYLDAIADEMARICQDKKTVVFLPLVRTAKTFAKKLNARGLAAREIDGQSPDRAESLEDFQLSKYKVLCNSMLLTEGWDCPDVDCIIVLRPTKSRALYCQMVGRGTRLADGKDKLLLLDFLWMTGRHDLCRPASLLGASSDVEARITEMVEEAMQEGLGLDLLGAEPEAEQDVQRAREEALAEQLERMRNRKAKLVDPLQYALSICDMDLQSYEPVFSWEKDKPTEKQREMLERRGINPDGMSAGMASKVIDSLMRRQDEGMATPKQVRMLERKGFVHPGTWSFEAANKMMSMLANNRWMVPAHIDPATYQPPATQVRRDR